MIKHIEEKIQEISNKTGAKIFVLKGFSEPDYPSESKKYFTDNLKELDKIDILKLRKSVIETVINNREFAGKYKWMTIEEFQLFNEPTILLMNQMPVVILENNLFNNKVPYTGLLSDVCKIYKELYEQEDDELNDNQATMLNNIEKFYGQIDFSAESGEYYVTYPEYTSDIPVFQMYAESEIVPGIVDRFPRTNVTTVELSEDEIPFLDIELKVKNGTNTKNIVFIVSGRIDDLPNNYLERIGLLNEIGKFNYYFVSPSIQKGLIKNEPAYTKLLKKIYHYPTFRNVRFYTNIESGSKDTLEISQAQIIDDIVTQSKNAITGKSFRDIYITASTGAGKSVMFQIPALYLIEKFPVERPLTIVISPLIGLMNDQVESMKKKGVENLATINGNVPPFEKEQIIERVQQRKVDVLYMSPETLQARSDIKSIIGNRKIGCVIIDEAHIVTTWGKSFRADYWYLGIYLAKLRKDYKFPIVTFTATAIYGGREDMYLDTRNSLNMINPISYFGEVRRNDIFLNVRSSQSDFENKGRDYRGTKDALALRHLKYANQKQEKTLMYFPTVKRLNAFYSYLEQNAPKISSNAGKYYGSLDKETKDEVLNEFKNGELKFVLATKAFGMGIDIPDINNVYHYAPTGNVVDYIQEIGRAARDNKLVPFGFGLIDFLPRDLNEVKQLHGMSAIRKGEIIEVMKKILSVYLEAGKNRQKYSRNLLIASEDFEYIFEQSNHESESEDSKQRNLDNKLKTVLLMIEKDFSSPRKLGYSPFVARPRSLFGNDFIFVSNEFEPELNKSVFGQYCHKAFPIKSIDYTAIYEVNLSGIWERFYRKMSYPQFKYALFNGVERNKLAHHELLNKFLFASGLKVTTQNKEQSADVMAKFRVILKSFEEFANYQKMERNQFTIKDLGKHFRRELHISDEFEARAFAQVIINSAFEFQKLKSIRFINERSNSTEGNKRYVLNEDADVFSRFVLSQLNGLITPKNNFLKIDEGHISFYYRFESEIISAKTIVLGIGEARGVLNYQVLGGNTPQIYVRINSIAPIERAIRQGSNYRNDILSDVQAKHYASVEMLKFLFTRNQPEKDVNLRIRKYSNWFWNTIESYFMGVLPEEVRKTLSQKR
jgi:ATP-dependent DNA helicase RecQ